jgi:hypothetical protein
VGKVEAGDGGDLEAAALDAAVAAVAGVVSGGDVWPGQDLELVVERGLVAFDDEQVGGALAGDQPVGVLTLGVERVLCRGGCYAEVAGGGVAVGGERAAGVGIITGLRGRR